MVSSLARSVLPRGKGASFQSCFLSLCGDINPLTGAQFNFTTKNPHEVKFEIGTSTNTFFVIFVVLTFLIGSS